MYSCDFFIVSYFCTGFQFFSHPLPNLCRYINTNFVPIFPADSAAFHGGLSSRLPKRRLCLLLDVLPKLSAGCGGRVIMCGFDFCKTSGGRNFKKMSQVLLNKRVCSENPGHFLKRYALLQKSNTL